MITPDNLLPFLVDATFNLSFMAMAAGAVFFIAMKNTVLPEHRPAMVVSGVILFIAALNYFYMKDIYADSVTTGLGAFPTSFRYIDWILTTPLMLAKFPLVLGLGKRGRIFMAKLIVIDICMILFGFFGEISIGNDSLHYGLFAGGFACWLIILFLLVRATSNLPDHFSPEVIKCVKLMVGFVLIGWTIYPLGYILPSFGLPLDVRELVYNVGDVVNKVGLALVVYAAGVALTKQSENSDQVG